MNFKSNLQTKVLNRINQFSSVSIIKAELYRFSATKNKEDARLFILMYECLHVLSKRDVDLESACSENIDLHVKCIECLEKYSDESEILANYKRVFEFVITQTEKVRYLRTAI